MPRVEPVVPNECMLGASLEIGGVSPIDKVAGGAGQAREIVVEDRD